MSQNITHSISELEAMNKYPKVLFYKGDLGLLKRPKISIVGTRRPSTYTKQHTYMLAKAYYNKGIAEFELERKDEAVESFKLAYYLFVGLNQSQNAEMLLEYVEEHCKIELIKQK